MSETQVGSFVVEDVFFFLGLCRVLYSFFPNYHSPNCWCAGAATPGQQGSTVPVAAQGPAPISTFSNDAEPGVPPVFDEHGAPAVPPKRVVVRGAFCKELAESVAAKLQPPKYVSVCFLLSKCIAA